MLYISRYCGNYKYGVVDSDDGIETIVSKDMIESYVEKDGLIIRGVEKYPISGRVKHIRCYQGQKEYLKRCARIKAVYGADVVIFDNSLVSIGAREGPEIRVSAIAPSLWSFAELRGGFTLVLDTPVVGDGDAIGSLAVDFNLSMADDKAAMTVYKGLLNRGVTMFSERVVDKPSRIGFLQSVLLLMHDELLARDWISFNALDSIQHIEKHYWAYFMTIAKADYTFHLDELGKHISSLDSKFDGDLMKGVELLSRRGVLYDVLSRASGVEVGVIRMFVSLMDFFSTSMSVEFRNLFMEWHSSIKELTNRG